MTRYDRLIFSLSKECPVEHDKLVQVIRHVIVSRDDSPLSRDPEDFDLDAIAAEAHERTTSAGVDELDPEEYWEIVEKHAGT